jgi:hypothetical protein
MPHIESNDIIWLIYREFLFWRRAVLYSGTIVSPTNACQATYSVPRYGLSALLEYYE